MFFNLICRKNSIITFLSMICGIHYTPDASDIFRVNSLFHILFINCLRLLLLVYLYWILEKSHTSTRVTLLSTLSTFILSWTDMTFEWSFMLCLVPIKFYFWTMPQITRSYNDNHIILCIRSSLLWAISDVKFISSKVRIVPTFSVN